MTHDEREMKKIFWRDTDAQILMRSLAGIRRRKRIVCKADIVHDLQEAGKHMPKSVLKCLLQKFSYKALISRESEDDKGMRYRVPPIDWLTLFINPDEGDLPDAVNDDENHDKEDHYDYNYEDANNENGDDIDYNEDDFDNDSDEDDGDDDDNDKDDDDDDVDDDDKRRQGQARARARAGRDRRRGGGCRARRGGRRRAARAADTYATILLRCRLLELARARLWRG